MSKTRPVCVIRQAPSHTSPSIHILDDDSLLNLFSLFRPSLFEGNQDDSVPRGNWLRERWWYKLVHVCKRWRHLILGSVSHLGLCLVCTRGTPVANMLARSPPLPIIVGFEDENHDLTAEDEEGIVLALQHRSRVRRIYFRMPVASLQKLTRAIDGDFPTLELLQIGPPAKSNTHLTLPLTFEAPQIRHLVLDHFTSPIGYPFLTSAVGLVKLLCRIHPSTGIYFHPNRLLQTLSLLPQLERLEMGFLSSVPNRERQLLHTPITTQITLPNLRRVSFRGISAYFDAFLPHMTTPLLESLSVYFFNQLSFSIPGLLQFMSATENLNFTTARFLFHHEAVAVLLYPRIGTRLSNFYVEVVCRHLDWQVYSVAQVFNALCPLLSSVVDLGLDYKEHSLSQGWHNEVDPTVARTFRVIYECQNPSRSQWPRL